jgi:hypothetical protein
MWREKANYPVVMMVRLLKTARSGYYKWVKANAGGAARKAGSARRVSGPGW